MPPTRRGSQRRSSDLSPSSGVRTGLHVADLKQSFLDNLFYSLGRVLRAATRNDAYTALALTVRDRVLKQGVRTLETYVAQDARFVAYPSAECLPGPPPAYNLPNLALVDEARPAMLALDLDPDELTAQEEDPD